MSRTQIDSSLVPSASTSIQNLNNILDNGGMEVWQRGTSFVNPATNSFSTDRWQFTYAGTPPVVTISQESSTIDSGSFSCKFVYTSVSGTSFTQFGQTIENFKAYAGKTITLSMRVWSNVAGSVLEIASAAGNFAQSSAHPGDSQWHTLTVTYTVVASPSFLICWFNPILAAGTHYIDSAMLVLGSTAVNFIPTNPQVELARCQRYYWQINSFITGFVAMLQCTSTTSAQGLIFFPTQMRAAPTTTTTTNPSELYTATGGGIGTSTITLGANVRSCNITVTVANSLVAGNATALVPTNPGFVIEFSADI